MERVEQSRGAVRFGQWGVGAGKRSNRVEGPGRRSESPAGVGEGQRGLEYAGRSGGRPCRSGTPPGSAYRRAPGPIKPRLPNGEPEPADADWDGGACRRSEARFLPLPGTAEHGPGTAEHDLGTAGLTRLRPGTARVHYDTARFDATENVGIWSKTWGHFPIQECVS